MIFDSFEFERETEHPAVVVPRGLRARWSYADDVTSSCRPPCGFFPWQQRSAPCSEPPRGLASGIKVRRATGRRSEVVIGVASAGVFLPTLKLTLTCRPTSGEEEGACGEREDGEAVHELVAVVGKVAVTAWLVAGTLGLGLAVWMGVSIVGVIGSGSGGEGDA